MSSHALLLRLFLSPSFFSLHVALKYLLIYSDNIGITYYLTHRLRQLDLHELRDVWGFICHLLVTRPSKSRALECFVIDIASRSTHIALLTLWFMQAALMDLSNRRDSRSFAICQRTLQKCHEIVFGDQLLPSSSPYPGHKLPAFSRRRKLNHHAEPVFVGLGVILASAVGMPQLAPLMGQVAIEQSRAEEDDTNSAFRPPTEDDYCSPSPTTSVHGDDSDDPDSPEVINESPTTGDPAAPGPFGDESDLLHRRRNMGARTLPALPLHLKHLEPKSRASYDPLGQSDAESAATAISYQSSPSLASSRTPRSSALSRSDALLERYDARAQMQLLRGHFYLSEFQFLLNLENICNRLVIVPKAARVSALRAELTAVNHKLPAEVCMPMWCLSSDGLDPQRGIPEPHHRIVRIPPGEAVVLNSAERAPYLLLIEILTDDLDFDPSRRSNKEVLRKVVTREGDSRGAWAEPVASPATARPSQGQPQAEPDSTRTPFLSQSATFLQTPFTASSANSSAFTDEDEEVDLIEQLFGDDEPLKSKILNIEDSIVMPPTPKNKELDMVAWSRSSPAPSMTPSVSNDPSLRPPLMHSRSLSGASTPDLSPLPQDHDIPEPHHRVLSLDEYSERMRTAAIMLAQLNSDSSTGSSRPSESRTNGSTEPPRTRLPRADALAIRERIMKEMNALEEERMERMTTNDDVFVSSSDVSGSAKTTEDEGIIRRELNKIDPSAVVFSESWSAKKSRIRSTSPYGHLANWDCVSVIVKTGGDLRQEQLAVQLIHEFQLIWAEEKCPCWVRYFRILITGGTSGLVETITDAVSIHSIKKAEYAKRLASGRLGHVTLMDHFKATYGDVSSAKFARAQKNFAKSLAGYSIITYLLQVKDRHNGNILLDREGHLIHIDFGFLFSNTPGGLGFEAAPFKLPYEYVEVLGGVDGAAFLEFKELFRQGFEAARKHSDRIITLVELMQKDSTLPCFAATGEQTANQLRERFQLTLTHSLIGDYINKLVDSSLGSHWTRLYDSYQYYSQSIL